MRRGGVPHTSSSRPAIAAWRIHPEIAVTSLLAHRAEPIALDMARGIIETCAALDPDRGKSYTDMVDEVARRTLETEMQIANYQPQNEVVKQYFEALAEARVALANALVTVLEARAIELTEEHRATIVACRDVKVLGRWIAGAATLRDADEILAG